MTPMVDGLRTKEKVANQDNIEQKMSASDDTNKIDIMEEYKTTRNKINKVYCVEANVEDNSLLSLTKHVIFPILKKKGINFIINRDDKYGGSIVIDNYENLITKFVSREVLPVDLKLGVVDNLEIIIKSIRDAFNFANSANPDIIRLAYPK